MPLVEELQLENFQAWSGTAKQTSRRRAYCKVWVGDLEVTDKVEPFLLSLRIIDGVNASCELELDDRDAKLPIPPIMTKLRAIIGWESEDIVHTFEGTITDVEHAFAREQGGRRLFIVAMALNQYSAMKAPYQDHLGEGAKPGQEIGELHSLPEFLQQIVKNAGGSISIHSSFDEHKRDYWSQNNESAIQKLESLAQEYGAYFRVVDGDHAEFTKAGEHPDGSTSMVIAKWRDNLISWRIRPFAARSIWGQSNQQFYDRLKGQWKHLEKKFGASFPWGSADYNAIFSLPAPAPNSYVADQQTGGIASNPKGGGRILINGEPTARWMGKVQVIGARPGVDGVYIISEAAEHLYSRQGYVTWLDVMPDTSSGAAPSISKGYEQPKPAPNTNAEESQTKIVSPSSSSTTYGPDGSSTTTNPDGSITIIQPDGSETWIPPLS